MPVRAKSRRRLFILLLIGVVLCGGLTAVYFVRQAQREAELQASLDRGMTALSEERFFDAIHAIGPYLKKHPEDIEATYSYALAREQVTEPRLGHLVQAGSFFRRVLDAQPERLEVREHLLEIYTKLGFSTETLDIIKPILEANPDHPRAIRAKALALYRMRQFKDAAPLIERYTQLAPDDVEGHLVLLSVMRQLDGSADRILKHAQDLVKAQPNSPTATIVMAYAHSFASDRANCLAWTDKAAALEAPDAEYTQRVAGLYDGLGEHGKSLATLVKADSLADKPELHRVLLTRLWQAGRASEVLERLADLDMADSKTDSALIALKALIFIQQQQPDEARPLVEVLAKREKDDVALAWNKILQAPLAEDTSGPSEMLAICGEALSYLPNEPYFLYLRGAAYDQMGEHAIALRDWNQAAQLAPAWASPMTRAAGALGAMGHPRAAIQAARAALQRAPNSTEAAVTLAESLWALADDLTDDSMAKLASLLEGIHGLAPFEPRTAAARIDVLVRTNKRAEAIEQMNAALKHDPPLPATAMLQMAAVSRKHSLGMEDAWTALRTSTYGADPQQLFEQAVQKARDGDPDEGKRLVEQAIAAQPPERQLPWQLMQARYLEVIGDPGALDAWRSVLDSRPDSLRLLQTALADRVVWSDLDYIDVLIERMKGLTSENAVQWRIAKARRLLSTGSEDRYAADASTILAEVILAAPSLVEPRLLAAQAHERLGNLSAASEQLAAAAALNPKSRSIPLEIVRLLQARGDAAQAKAILDRLMRVPGASEAESRRTAALLAQQGDIQAAIDLIVQLHDGDETAPDLLLANLYRRSNQFDKVAAICHKLLEKPSVIAVEFAADFFASQDQLEDAEKAMALLDDMELQPGVRELLRANFAARYLEPQIAAKRYEEATVAAPQLPTAWLARISFLFRQAETDGAMATINEAAAAVPDEPTIKLLKEHENLLPMTLAEPAYRPLALATLVRSNYQPVVFEALRWISESARANRTPLETALGIQKLADRYPRFLPLQNLLVRLQIAAGRPDDAAERATRMQAFPQAVEPAWMAAEALAAAGRWSEALSVAREWRQRSLNQPIAADLMISEAHRRLGESDQALQQTDQYLAQAQSDPESYMPILVSRARALISAGQAKLAREMMLPYLDAGPRWRGMWVQLAVFAVQDDKLAADWLTELEPHIDKSAPSASDELLLLGAAWHSLGQRADNAAYRDKGAQITESIVQQDAADARALVSYAIMLESKNQPEPAAELYRRALQADADLHVAHNNLAMILLNAGKNLDEALTHALAATKSQPRNPSYLDTLGMVHLALEHHDEALTVMRQAVKLQPSNRDLQVNLAWTLLQNGKPEEARRSLTDALGATPALYRLSDHMRQRAETILNGTAGTDPS